MSNYDVWHDQMADCFPFIVRVDGTVIAWCENESWAKEIAESLKLKEQIDEARSNDNTSSSL